MTGTIPRKSHLKPGGMTMPSPPLSNTIHRVTAVMAGRATVGSQIVRSVNQSAPPVFIDKTGAFAIERMPQKNEPKMTACVSVEKMKNYKAVSVLPGAHMNAIMVRRLELTLGIIVIILLNCIRIDSF